MEMKSLGAHSSSVPIPRVASHMVRAVGRDREGTHISSPLSHSNIQIARYKFFPRTRVNMLTAANRFSAAQNRQTQEYPPDS